MEEPAPPRRAVRSWQPLPGTELPPSAGNSPSKQSWGGGGGGRRWCEAAAGPGFFYSGTPPSSTSSVMEKLSHTARFNLDGPRCGQTTTAAASGNSQDKRTATAGKKKKTKRRRKRRAVDHEGRCEERQDASRGGRAGEGRGREGPGHQFGFTRAQRFFKIKTQNDPLNNTNR